METNHPSLAQISKMYPFFGIPCASLKKLFLAFPSFFFRELDLRIYIDIIFLKKSLSVGESSGLLDTCGTTEVFFLARKFSGEVVVFAEAF